MDNKVITHKVRAACALVLDSNPTPSLKAATKSLAVEWMHSLATSKPSDNASHQDEDGLKSDGTDDASLVEEL